MNSFVLREVKEIFDTAIIDEIIERLKTERWIVFGVIQGKEEARFILGRISD